MGTSSGAQNPLLVKLLSNPSSFDFFQAVRLLELIHIEDKIKGSNSLFSLEPFIRFSVYHKNTFSLSNIENLTQEIFKSNQGVYHLQVAFMGLTGIHGALPPHYTEKLLIEAHQGNFILRDFLDIFNHRFVLLFYEAWKKNRFFVGYETALLENQKKTDTFTNILKSIAGVEALPLNGNFLLRQEMFSFYASLWGREIRSAVAFERLLNEYFGLPFRILSFQGQWLFLPEKERSKIASFHSGKGQYHHLGQDIVVGHQRWCVQSKFRLYIGPLNYEFFEKLLPGSEFLQMITEIVNIYTQKELSFDIELELLAAEVPRCELSCKKPMCLGWNTWINNQPFNQNAHAFLLNNND